MFLFIKVVRQQLCKKVEHGPSISVQHIHTRSPMGMEPCQNVKMRVLYIGDVRGMLLSAHSDLTEMPFPRWKLMKPAAHLPQFVWKFSLLGHKVHLLSKSSHEILNFKLFIYLYPNLLLVFNDRQSDLLSQII